MKTLIPLILFLLTFSTVADGQRRRSMPVKNTSQVTREVGAAAVVMDETISVLRSSPSLYADAIQRMRRGRRVKIVGVKEADGVRFFRIIATPPAAGWIQADAVFSEKRPEDEERLARLVQASKAFEQIEAAVYFQRMYPRSKFKPPILLLFGDALEDIAARLSRDANNRLDRREMAATGAPLHSYYLNFVSLDRYRRLGITFVFNPATRAFHYNGESWKEIVEKFAGSEEAVEAGKRLESFKEKMARSSAK
jgi:hypothetical protein